MSTTINIDPSAVNDLPPPKDFADDSTATGRRRPRVPYIILKSCVCIIALVLLVEFTDSQRITANWTVGFKVENPNRRSSISYTDGGEVSVSYFGYNSLGETGIAPFFQSPKNSTTLVVEPKALFRNISESKAGVAIWEDLQDGVISFDVNIRLEYQYGNGGKHKENYLCGDMELFYAPYDPTGFGRMRQRSKSCQHYTHN
ncbi:OLC1v1013489C1 [Oldenlandia corymbosa var. corymbosa]|uniref:OLC1v1013489C1 n=1 Tax=Oldenlandia corymbosa var. corymbosa TaxID=529605 RepID=A0AAV1DYD0_OLDCO|nr:OLC1v1013489C1 [Oldenlandia corymbosa var. corymbosa]